jgi:plasmid maintenance system antidote protein VapI
VPRPALRDGLLNEFPFWLNLQDRYDIEVERDRLGPTLEEIQPLTPA